jgi:hypothetical protein
MVAGGRTFISLGLGDSPSFARISVPSQAFHQLTIIELLRPKRIFQGK